MPSSRRMRVSILVALLTLAIIFYATTGASSTHNSAFYQRTLAALREKHAAAARQDVIAEELVRNERVERLQKEHDVAMEIAKAEDGTASKLPTLASARPASGGVQRPSDAQKPIADKEKSVAGRKKMKDDKVVQGKPAAAPQQDGVAKIGNIAPTPSNVAKGDGSAHTEADHLIETTLNDILKKSPIIIFSKSYCPYSKKAKHVLLDLYDISPPPFVVELDQHELGSSLQSALEASTGRRTVPNVLINGKSIGGGDDIEALHDQGKLIDTVQTMGGRRIVKAEKKELGSS